MISFRTSTLFMSLGLLFVVSGCGTLPTMPLPTSTTLPTTANLATATSNDISTTSVSSTPEIVTLNATSSLETKGAERIFHNTYFSLSFPRALHFTESTSTTGLTLTWDKNTYPGMGGSSPLRVEMDFEVTTETKKDCMSHYTDTMKYFEESTYADNSGFSAEMRSKYGGLWYSSFETDGGLGNAEEFTYHELPSEKLCYRLAMHTHFSTHLPENLAPSTYKLIDSDGKMVVDSFDKIIESFTLPNISR